MNQVTANSSVRPVPGQDQEEPELADEEDIPTASTNDPEKGAVPSPESNKSEHPTQ